MGTLVVKELKPFVVDWYKTLLCIDYFCLTSKRSLYDPFYSWNKGVYPVILIDIVLGHMVDHITFDIVISKL